MATPGATTLIILGFSLGRWLRRRRRQWWLGDACDHGHRPAERYTPSAALPEGSRSPDHRASHSVAFAVLHCMPRLALPAQSGSPSSGKDQQIKMLASAKRLQWRCKLLFVPCSCCFVHSPGGRTSQSPSCSVAAVLCGLPKALKDLFMWNHSTWLCILVHRYTP